MAMTEELEVYKSMYKLLMAVLDAREHFPKSYKYEFGSDFMRLCVRCTELLRYANSDFSKRIAYLEEFLIKFDVVKLYIRICRDRKIISVNQTSNMLVLVEEINKQIRGWRNYTAQSQGQNR